jgi:outer membrane protein assembly factor BamB
VNTRSSGLLLLSVACIVSLSGCPSPNKPFPSWNQLHGDPANSSQIALLGTKPAKDGTAATTQVGPIIFSSPVLAPDGSVYIATRSDTQEPSANELIRLSIGSAVGIRKRIALGGQLTTPAVDRASNVYVARYFKDNESHLLSFNPQDEPKWNISLGKNTLALGSPKVLDVSGGSFIFQAYSGGSPFGAHLLVANDRGQVLGDNVFCQHIVNFGFCCNFTIPPLESGKGVLEQPAIAIGVVQGQQYLALASHRCGVNFFRLGLGETTAIMPTLTPIDFHQNDSVFFSSPAISTSGILVIANSNKRVTAFDVPTGKEKWHYDTPASVFATPTVMPFGIVYVASYDRLTKLNLETGQVEGEIVVIGRTDASAAVGGSNIFVSTEFGLFTYNLDLKPLAFAPLAGGTSSPALGPNGEVLVASRDGSFYVFPGP